MENIKNLSKLKEDLSKNIVNIGDKKEMRLNINYIDFIKEVKERKLKNKEDIIKLYGEVVNLRFNNIFKIDFRSKRLELRKILVEVLKEKNLSLDEYFKISKEIVSLSMRNKRESNYLSIEV
jgi:hypothetical protein